MQKKIKSLYLSGGISGVQDYKSKFSRAHALASGCGFAVISPVLIGKLVNYKMRKKGQPQWADYMRACIAVLSFCDTIAMLPGWEKSKGARIERRIALDLGLDVIKISKNYDALIK